MLRRAGSPHVLTPTELASTLLLSKAGMTARLDRLAAAGWVERTLDETNRRSFRIRLTDSGFVVVDAAMTDHTANVTRLLQSIATSDTKQLDALLRQLLVVLSTQHGDQ